MGNYRALIIACELSTGDFTPIPNVTAEAKAFGKALVAFGYESFEVEYHLDDSKSNVVEAVGKFFTSAAPDDFILFYFGGHGQKEDDGDLYLVLRDTRRKNLITTSLPAVTLNKLINKCPAQKKVIVLDACYSAAIEKGSLADSQKIDIERYIKQGKGTAILTSSNAAQLSYSREDQRSFTYFLTEGLRNGNADANDDGVISIEEWFQYARAAVEKSQIGPIVQNPQLFYKNQESPIYIGRVIMEEEPDVPATNLPHSSPPPLKCELGLIGGEVPQLSIILTNMSSFELTAVEVTGYTPGSTRALEPIKSLSPGERVEIKTSLYSDAGPLLQLLIRANDAYNRAFLPAVVPVASPIAGNGNSGRTPDQRSLGAPQKPGRPNDVSASDLGDDEDESILNRKSSTGFH